MTEQRQHWKEGRKNGGPGSLATAGVGEPEPTPEAMPVAPVEKPFTPPEPGDSLTVTQKAVMLQPPTDARPAPPEGDLPEWFVVVRGTTLLVKNGFVRARNPEEARRKFLDINRSAHDAKAATYKATEEGRRSAKEVLDCFEAAVGSARIPQQSSDWSIVPAEGVRQQWQSEARQRLVAAEAAMAGR